MVALFVALIVLVVILIRVLIAARTNLIARTRLLELQTELLIIDDDRLGDGRTIGGEPGDAPRA